jgi:hypothetical protein
MVGGIISMVVEFATGATLLADRAREFLGVFLFVMLLFLLLVLRRIGSQRADTGGACANSRKKG